MRVFVTGKGGVGKTTVSAALASALAEAGLEVVAVDADGSPNLALALGAGDPERLPAVANETPPRRDDGCAQPELSLESLGDFAVPTAAGPRLLQTGRIERPAERCLCCGSHSTAREVIAALPKDDRRAVVADLEPGLNDLLWARPGPGDVVVVVTEASKKSLEVARRTIGVAGELGVSRILVVANKLRPDEAERVRTALPGVEVVDVAYDPSLDRAVPGRQGPDGVRAVLDRLAPDPA